MVFFLFVRITVKDFELPTISAQRQSLQVIFIMIILNGVHCDVVEIIKVDKTHSLSHFPTKKQLRTSTQLFGQLLRNDHKIVPA